MRLRVYTFPLEETLRARSVARLLNAQVKRGVRALGCGPMHYSTRKWRYKGVIYIALYATAIEEQA